jgi:pectate lyase
VGTNAGKERLVPWKLILRTTSWTLAFVASTFVLKARGADSRWLSLLERSDAWYRSPEGARIAANILSFQSAQGSWPKNVETTAQPYTGDRRTLLGTFDNGATFGELRFLARSYQATRRLLYSGAFYKGLDHVLRAQYPTVGWPQLYPPGQGYHRRVTFNDGVMVNVLEFLRDVAQSPAFSFVDHPRRSAAQKAVDSGIRCIMNCQILSSGVLTIWCAQHDEQSLQPRWGRSFEPPALTSAESAGVVRFLMGQDHPSPEIRRSIHAASQWFERSAIHGIRQVRRGGDKVVLLDQAAPPLWARFYEVGSGRPIFCGRDGLIQYDLSRIEPERRNGYAWYGDWGEDVAARYREWKRKWQPDCSSPP